MSDTAPEVERQFRALLLERSGEERLKMGCSMHATAQALVRASVLEKDPQASPATLRLDGGTKKRQSLDIQRSRERWSRYQSRKS